MALLVEAKQFRLRDKSGESDSVLQMEVSYLFLKGFTQGAIPGDCETCFRELPDKRSKCSDRGFEPFLLDQTAGLEKTPPSIVGSYTRQKTKCVQGYSGSLNLEFFRRTPKIDKRKSQGLGSCQHHGARGEQQSQHSFCDWRLDVHVSVGAMKRYNRRQAVPLQERQPEKTVVTKINMQHPATVRGQCPP